MTTRKNSRVMIVENNFAIALEWYSPGLKFFCHVISHSKVKEEQVVSWVFRVFPRLCAGCRVLYFNMIGLSDWPCSYFIGSSAFLIPETNSTWSATNLGESTFC